jgi:hypothetical protein
VGNNPINLVDPSGEIAPLVAIPLIIGGTALAIDWGVQVYQNICTRDMSFWDAVHHKNLSIDEMATIGIFAWGGTTLAAGAIVPGALMAGGALLQQSGLWFKNPTVWNAGMTANTWTVQWNTWWWVSKSDRLETANLGRKLDYMLGKGTGSQHNIDRSHSMLTQLERIGLSDNPNTRQYLTEHLSAVLNDPTNIVSTQVNGAVIQESLLMGPSGGLKVRSVWQGNKLITMMLYGSK